MPAPTSTKSTALSRVEIAERTPLDPPPPAVGWSLTTVVLDSFALGLAVALGSGVVVAAVLLDGILVVAAILAAAAILALTAASCFFSVFFRIASALARARRLAWEARVGELVVATGGRVGRGRRRVGRRRRRVRPRRLGRGRDGRRVGARTCGNRGRRAHDHSEQQSQLRGPAQARAPPFSGQRAVPARAARRKRASSQVRL